MAAITTTGTATSTPDTVSASGTLSGTALGIDYFGTGAELAVYIAFPNGVTDTSFTWTEVTSDIVRDQPVRIQRGRSSERDTFQTGTATFALLNTARKYDPEYASSPYNGNLLPGRPVKIELTYDATTTVLFFGFIQGWPQAWERSDNKSVVSIVAHDAFKYLARFLLPTDRYIREVLADDPTALYRLGDADDELVCLDSSGNDRHGKYLADTTLRGTLTSGLIELSTDGARAMTGTADTSQQLIATDLHYLSGTTFSWEAWMTLPTDFNTSSYNDVPMTVWAQGTNEAPAFRVVTALTTEPVATAPSIRMRIVRTLTDTVLFGVQIADGTNTYEDRWNLYNRTLDGFRHHYVVTRNGSTLKLYIDGVEVTRTSTTGTLSAGSTAFGTYVVMGNFHRGTWAIDEVALYDTELASGVVADHHFVGVLASAGQAVDTRMTSVLSDAGLSWIGTDFEASQVTVRGADYQSQPVLSYLQTLERTEQGRLFVAGDGTLTFHNNGHDIGETVAAAFTDVAGGSLPYAQADYEYDDVRVFTDATVSRVNGKPQRYSVASDQGPQPIVLDGLQHQTDALSLSLAQYLVGRYQDPSPRVRALTVTPRTNPAGLFPAVRDLEIGAKVTFRRLPLGTGSAFTKTLMVEGVSHSIGVDGEWVTTYLTSPTDSTNVGRWDEGLWDSSKWGL